MTTEAGRTPSPDEKARAFSKALTELLREVGMEAFSPDVQRTVERIMQGDLCPKCRYLPKPYDGPGIPINVPGTTHHADCPTVPQMSAEARRALNKRLDEMARARIDNRPWRL
jgi:hypothetical protein